METNEDKEVLYEKLRKVAHILEQFPQSTGDLISSDAWKAIREAVEHPDPYVRLLALKGLASLAREATPSREQLFLAVDLSEVAKLFWIDQKAIDDMAHDDIRARELRRIYHMPMDENFRQLAEPEAEALLVWALDDWVSIYPNHISIYPPLEPLDYLQHVASILTSPDIRTREMAYHIAAGLVHGLRARQKMAELDVLLTIIQKIYNPYKRDYLLSDSAMNDAKHITEYLLRSTSARQILINRDATC